MVFIKNCFNFHIDVFQKIMLNLKFFIFLFSFYLVIDILKFYQPVLASGFKEEDIDFLQSLINLGIGSILMVAYLSYASLWAVYFKRNENFITKLKSFFSVLFNFRMYIVYFMFIIIIIIGLSLSLRFLPEVNELLTEVLKVFTSEENKLLNDSDKISIILNSNEILSIYNEITIYQKIAASFTFIMAVVISYFSFLFSLPLVIMNKSNKAFHSIKRSILSCFLNLHFLIFTIIAFFILSSFIESLFLEIDYLNKAVPVFLNSILFFYIVIGLEKFVLTNDKNSV